MKDAILRDLVRVAEELKYTPTRREYSKLGSFSKHAINKEFGSFSNAIMEAGLTSRMFKKRFEEVTIKESFSESILPFVGKYEKPPGEIIRIVSGGDFHSLWVDKFCLHVFIETCGRIQPDVIALIGDVVDFYDVSRFSKDPSRIMDMQKELDFITENIFAPLRAACPFAQIDFFIGNHEWRLFKYLCEQARGLASLRSLQFDKLFELDKYKINLVARNSLVNAKSEKDLNNYKVYGGKYVLTHGTSLGLYQAAAELRRYNMSGSSGHAHRYQTASGRDLGGSKTWTSMGCMCQLKSGEEYIADLVAWTQGFEIAHINTKSGAVMKEYVQFADGEVMVGGVYYSEK